MSYKILSIFGTRPEAIKMAPLVRLLNADDSFDHKVCVTGQHREMLDKVLLDFKVKPDFDLDVMGKGETLCEIASVIMTRIQSVFDKFKPDLVIVHGDTLTTSVAALAAYLNQITVGHVEAGLRTGNLNAPWPEEGNRKLVASLSCFHFAPTELSKSNLINENVDDSKIFVTGNTVIDALFLGLNMIREDRTILTKLKAKFPMLEKDAKKILVTSHRRENFGDKLVQICEALRAIALKHEDTQIIFPVHLNPNVRKPATTLLSNIENIYLIEPQDYLPFIYLMEKSDIILTDSGGIQEEAPSLGKPVLVLRDVTERTEAISAGTVKLIGTETFGIVSSVEKLLFTDVVSASNKDVKNPFGDGTASQRILEIIKSKILNL